MTRSEILAFINANPVFYLATSVNNQPFVRAMRIYRADDNGIIFNTSNKKSVCRHLLANPVTESCFCNEQDGVEVRIRGKAVPVTDPDMRAAIVADAPVLAPHILDDGPGGLAIFRIEDARAKVWKMDEAFVLRALANAQVCSVWMALYEGTAGRPAE